jgi:DHA1 family solute carrier family 18 vesicular amine transporter 1/2
MGSGKAVAVALVTFATFTDLLAYSVCVPVLPDLANRLGASPTMIGALFGSFGITLLAVSVPLGAVSDRIGRRVPLVLSAVGLAGASMLFAYSRSLPWLFTARMLQGAADGAMWVTGFALVADLYGPEDRGRVMGYVMSGTSVGFMLGPAVGGWLYETGGIELPFLVVAGLSLLCAIAFAMLVPPREELTEAPPLILSVLRDEGVARCAALIVVTGTTFAMLEPVLPLFFARSLGLTPARIGLVFGAGAVASAVMPFVYGPLVPKLGARRMMFAGLLVTASLLPLMIFAEGFRSAVLIVLIQWSASALVITPSLAYMAEVTSFAGASAYGVGYGVYNASWALGLLIGPVSGGYLFDRLGFTRLLLSWVPIVLALTILIAGPQRREERAPV